MPNPLHHLNGSLPEALASKLRVPGAVAYSGLSRTHIYMLIGQGEIEAVKAGRTLLIDRASIDRYLASLPPAQIRAPKSAA